MGNLFYDQLEKASESGNTKSTFIDRLIDEYNEVYARRLKLNKFLNDYNKSIRDSDNSLSLLIAQLYAMDTYIQILRLRFLELHISWEDYHKVKEGEDNEGN